MRCILILLFAIVGHEALMSSAHASADHAGPAAAHAHVRHDNAPRPAAGNGNVTGAESEACSPAHKLVRRAPDPLGDLEHASPVRLAEFASGAEARQGPIPGTPPGRPPDRLRALLQVFLN